MCTLEKERKWNYIWESYVLKTGWTDLADGYGWCTELVTVGSERRQAGSQWSRGILLKSLWVSRSVWQESNPLAGWASRSVPSALTLTDHTGQYSRQGSVPTQRLAPHKDCRLFLLEFEIFDVLQNCNPDWCGQEELSSKKLQLPPSIEYKHVVNCEGWSISQFLDSRHCRRGKVRTFVFCFFHFLCILAI